MLQLYRRTRRSASSSTEDKALLSVRANVGASAGAGAGNSTSPISDGASPTRSTSAAAASSSTAALTASTSTSAIWSIRPSDAQRIALDRLLRLYPDADPGYLAHCLSHYKSSSQNQSQNQGQSQEAGPSSPTSPTTPTFRKRSGSKARSVREYAGSVGGNGGGAGQEYPNDNTKTEGRAGTEVGIEARELVARVGEKVRDANWGIYPTAVWDCARDGSGRTQVDVVRTRNRDLLSLNEMFPTVEPAYLRSLLSATSNSRAYSATRHLLHAADPKEGTEKPERRPAALRSRSMPRSREDDAKSVRNEAERDLSGTRSGDRQRSQERHEPREERRLRKSERREQRRARRGERVGIGAELEGKMTNFAQETLQLGISSLDGALSRLLPASISSTPTASTASFVADDSVAQNDGAESSSSSPSPSGRVPLRPQAFYLSHADLFRTPSYITSVRSYLAQKTNGKLSTSSLENIMRECNHDLALSLARADEVVRNRGLFRRWLDGWGLRSGVESAAQPADSDPEFEMELAVLEREERQVSLRADEKVARDLNEKAYEDEGQSIECGCCFGEYAWETLCACAEGHLFCINCVSRRVSEYLFGATAGGRAGGKDDAGGDWAPRCMDIDSGCTAPFPPLAIERALSSSPELRTALDRRAADAALEALVCPPSQSRGVWAMLLSRAVSRTAAGKNRAASKVRVVKCPFCEYAVVHDTDVLGDLWRARGDWAVTAPSKLVMNGQPRISSTVTAASKRSSAGRSELDSDSYSDSDRSRASSPTLSPSPKAEQSTNDDAPPNAALANASRAATAAGTAFVDFATSQWFRGTVLRPVILTLLYLVLFSLLILLDPFLPGAFGPASSASSFSSSSSPSSNDHSHHLPALIDPIGSLARVSGTLERAATELLRARGRRLGVFRCGRVQQGLGSGRALAEGAHSTDGAHAALWETVYPASDGTRSVRSDKKANEQAQSHCGRLSCLACGNEWLGPAHRCGGTGSMGGAKNDEADLGRLRRAIEIALDNAVLRTCPGCATTFIKEDGCNKMVCRCGTKMCYVCRETVQDYRHFCQHFRPLPGQPCPHCTKCDLYRVPSERESLRAAAQKAKSEFFAQHPHLAHSPLFNVNGRLNAPSSVTRSSGGSGPGFRVGDDKSAEGEGYNDELGLLRELGLGEPENAWRMRATAYTRTAIDSVSQSLLARFLSK